MLSFCFFSFEGLVLLVSNTIHVIVIFVFGIYHHALFLMLIVPF